MDDERTGGVRIRAAALGIRVRRLEEGLELTFPCGTIELWRPKRREERAQLYFEERGYVLSEYE